MSGQAKPTARLLAQLGDPIIASLLFIALVSAVFLAFPDLDVGFSALFWNAQSGFQLRGDRLLLALRKSNDIAVIVAVAAILAGLATKLAAPTRPSLIRPSHALFLGVSLALGPGLLVNAILKDHWGRPRPPMITTFGGIEPYVPVWEPSDSCVRNCSFVAGETSSAVWLIGLAILLPARWRPVGVAAGCLYAALISLNRIAFGGHFLSDVLLSIGLTMLVMSVVYRLVVERPPPWLANDRLEAAAGKLAARLTRERRGLGRR